MDPQDKSTTDIEGQSRLAPLIRTLGPATVVYLFFIVLTVFSLLQFVYQRQQEVAPGVRYVDEPLGFIHVWSHALRVAIGALLTISLHRYLAGIRAVRRKDADADFRVLASITVWWKSMAISVALIVAYGLWAEFVSRPPAPKFKEFEQFPAIDAPEVSIEFRLAEPMRVPGKKLLQATIPQTGQSIWLHSTPAITNDDIEKAVAFVDPDGEVGINVVFTPKGEAAIREATKLHVKRPLAIIIDGRIVSAPIVEWELGKSAMIYGMGTINEAKRIARSLSGQKQPVQAD